MNKLTSFALILTVLVSINLSAASSLDKEKQKISKTIEQMKEAQLSGNFRKLMNYYTDETILLTPFQPPVQGFKEIRRRLDEGVEQGLQIKTLDGEIKDFWICDNLAYVRSKFSMSYTTNNLPNTQAIIGSGFTIFEKQKNGEYKIKMDIWNLDFNPYGK